MKKILWIDDDETLIVDCTPIFQRYGFYILGATSVSQALNILRNEALDGILLDVKLSGSENGLALLDELKAMHPTLKVVIFTGYPDYVDHQKAETRGASIYLEKIDKSIPLDPIKQRAFFDALHTIFENRQDMSSTNKVTTKDSPTVLLHNALVFLLLFLLILTGIAIVGKIVPAWIFPVALIGSVIVFSVVGAFILRASGDYLSEKNFVSLLFESFRYLPFLRTRSKDKEKGR
jgi:ActR/RegA family two-component response regulator